MKLFKASPLLVHLLQVTNAQKGPRTSVVSWPPGKDPVTDNPIPDDKIVGGQPVSPEDRYPYQVAVTTSSGFQYCAGSLIAPSWVLSAAHCAGESGGKVQIGRFNLDDNTETYENIEVDYEVTHPQYNGNNLDNDYMLLRLKTPSQYPLVSIDGGGQDTSAGVDVNVMGWGTTSAGGNSSPLLLEVEVDIISNSDCNTDYGGGVTDNMICAARAGKDACQGDSGGPLIIRGNDATQDVLVGIVSWGIGCASPSYPGVYSRVSEGYDWITQYVSFGPTGSPTSSAPTVSSPPTVPCLQMEISLLTDNYGSETSWDVTDPDGNVVVSDSGYASNTQYNLDYCLSPTCDYTFTIRDSYGDGICCSWGSGSYLVTYGGDEVVSGGSFAFVESTNFGCVTPSSPCVDSGTPISYNGGLVSCAQVVAGNYCSNAIAASHCPLSCSTCVQSKCEDSQAPWTFGGGTYDCDDVAGLTSSSAPYTIEAACAVVGSTCRGTCGYCN